LIALSQGQIDFYDDPRLIEHERQTTGSARRRPRRLVGGLAGDQPDRGLVRA
jgi:hypothetical protein